ncbi:MAG: ATP-dependent Clp protease ATP-binding subunit ClpB, partial [Thermoleophilaceae bacterium]|nr:ATP-dependent Clp protease ATP-binding subunit ClpB [Thermoleophilaceae bacterium]
KLIHMEDRLHERVVGQAEASTNGKGGFLKEEVDDEDVAEVVAKWTGIPVSKLMEGEVEKLIHMEDRLHERVIGQDEAVEAVANALRRSRRRPTRHPPRAARRSSAISPSSASAPPR